jgi:hypothetical protein
MAIRRDEIMHKSTVASKVQSRIGLKQVIQLCSIQSFQTHGDERGSLVAIEALKQIPFEIKRVYYLYGTAPDMVRGKHAHKNLEQLLVCINGCCRILIDDDFSRSSFLLNSPDFGLYCGIRSGGRYTWIPMPCFLFLQAIIIGNPITSEITSSLKSGLRQ